MIVFCSGLFQIWTGLTRNASPGGLQDSYSGRDTKLFNKVLCSYKASLYVSMNIFKMDNNHSNGTNNWLAIIQKTCL